jgi:hypothetical protein
LGGGVSKWTQLLQFKTYFLDKNHADKFEP